MGGCVWRVNTGPARESCCGNMRPDRGGGGLPRSVVAVYHIDSIALMVNYLCDFVFGVFVDREILAWMMVRRTSTLR